MPHHLHSWRGTPDAGSVGDLAERAGVRHLVPTHVLPTPRTGEDERALVAEARRGGYGGPITIATDLLEIDVPGRDSPRPIQQVRR
jgi:ribonuclease BN (tRNA processing enzyme)